MFGYAKIFQQIFDSSIAGDWQVRHVFEDLLKLANSDGVVDMTHEAIARRTNTPLEIVARAIAELEKPDPYSRSTIESGARIKRLDDHRDWGWWVVNHAHYRGMTTDEQYREKTRARVRKFRENTKQNDGVTLRNVTVTHVTPSRGRKQIADAEANTDEKTETDSANAPASRAEILKMVVRVFDAWNAQNVLPRCLVVSDKRRRSLEVRLSEPFFASNWEAALSKIQVSRFCRGESDRGWKADFDWFIKPDVCTKIMEGKYDNGTSTRTGNNRGSMQENPRNACVTKGPTDYAAVFKRKAEEREKAELARQILEAESQSSETNGA